MLLRSRSGVGEADGAVEVAGGVDLDDPQTRVLCVLGADPAVVRTALRDLGLSRERAPAGLVESLDLQVALGVPIHDRLDPSVYGALTAQDDPALADDQDRLEDGPA